MNKALTGTGVALITPFDEKKNIDYPALARMIDFLAGNGIDYLVLMGTTGESVTLSKEEKKELIVFTRAHLAGRIPLVLGMGGNNTSDILQQLGSADFSGITAILSVSPYYNKPQQEGIYQHYREIARVSPLPLILYNVPGRTGSNMAAATTLRLARDFNNIVAVKEASGNLVQVMEILHGKPEGFLVISGDDILTLPMIAMGATGVISVAAQAVPATFSSMVNHAMKGDFPAARSLHYKMQDLMSALFADGSPAGIKAALEILGYCRNELRLPLVPVNPAIYGQIKAVLQAF